MSRKRESEHRIRWALEQLLKCRSHSAVVSELADSEGLSRRQARRYVAEAYDAMKADFADLDRPALAALCINGLMQALGQALESGQGAVVVGAVRQLTVLAGLDPTAGTTSTYSGRSRIR